MTRLTKKDWQEIERIADEHEFMSGQENRDRDSVEVFTPTFIVLEMFKSMPLNKLAIGRNYLDPTCGDGQFLVPAALLKYKLMSSRMQNRKGKLRALSEIFGVDIQKGNVKIARNRLLKAFGLEDDLEARELVKKTIIHGNTLEPTHRLEDQCEADHKQMKRIFGRKRLV